MSKQSDKFEAMTKEERFIYMATARGVTVERLQQVDTKADPPALRSFYLAQVRGITVGDKGKWQFETETEAREFGERILAGWKEELKAMVKAAEEAASE